MKELKQLDIWLTKWQVIEAFKISHQKLRILREKKKVTHRLEGRQFLFEAASLIEYANSNAIKAEISEPQNGDEELTPFMKEVMRKEKENKMEKERNSNKEARQ